MIKIIITFLFLTSFSAISAELKLLYDTGKATVFNKTDISDIKMTYPDPIEVLKSRFPIESKLWTLATFESKEIQFPEMRSPIFLVGCEETSLNWVTARKALLENQRSLGFVINCPSFEDYEAFKEAIQPIVVQAANLDQLVEVLHHNKYPAYIHSKAIEQ